MIDKPRGPFRYGDRVQLTGPKGKLHTVTLREGGELHTHVGVLTHAQLIGLPDGSVVENTAGHEYLALRPLLRDFVMSMPRGAAIVYPKDAAAIVQQADIFPGAVVVEAGVGSGALSLSLLRAIGEGGSLTSFERRPDFAEVASLNVETFFGERPPQWRIVEGDLAEELPAETEPGSVDRVVLDMLAPWEVMPAVSDALAPGGVVICYVATATQLSRTAEFIRGLGGFTDPDASETMVRGWHVEGLAVRPDHRMVAHTGFLLTARKLAPGTIAPEAKRRASKSSYGDEDVETWTPGAVGDREITDKNLRKRVKEAQKAVDGARIAAASRRTDDGHGGEQPETIHPEHPADDEGEAPTRA
ncbi:MULTISPECIES: tRNA (adenine-N1)-methyltransferase [unclassified Microbacterium]|uniref:tRNA (adenine-N1)-methyltransferase n=1 Tax=unclassified Microbacterium TaxID=2609290 RepID=UPI00097EAAB5|nr:tRNA (adenine-N1)-methyltransferase [Microbacterium sp. JB110]RCS63089.1 tRNA (adenine-N1)-methyltransferase [Microbacterium sp. JB110]SJM60016.1 Protein-L-isoaspartate methyltransferase [Frigoribacterium sp. JB110]